MRVHVTAIAALLLLSVKATAFTTPGTTTITTTTTLLNVVRDPSTENKTTATKKGFKPRPPDSSPPEESSPSVLLTKAQLEQQMDALVEDMWAQEQIVQEKQQLIRGLTSVLHEKTRDMLALETSLQEDVELQNQAEELQQQIDQTQKSERQTEQDHQTIIRKYEAAESQLQAQVGALQQELVRLGHQLRAEKERYSSLQQRMLEVEGTSDWEEEEFQKDKERLESDLKVQQEQLEEWSTKQQAEEASQKEGLAALRAKLSTLGDNVQKELLRLEVQRQDHQEQRNDLQKSIQQQEQEIGKAKEELTNNQNANTEAMEQLQSEVEQKQQEYQTLQEAVANEKVEIAQLKLEVEDRALQTKQILEQRTYQLKNAETRSLWETEFMQDKLAAESKRLELVQSQLQKETQANNKVRANWHAKIDVKRQRTRRTKQRMRQRFTGLRRVLTDRLYSAKREGKQLEKSLREQYNVDVTELENTLELLQDSVVLSQQATQRLKERVEVESQLAQKAAASRSQIDMKFAKNVAKADKEILRLLRDRNNLRWELEQTDQDLDQIHSSGRAILRAGWRLTRSKARNARRKIRKILPFRRKE